GDCRRVFFSEPGSGPRERAAQRRNVSSPFAQPDLLPRLSLVTRLASDCRPCALFPFSVPDVARRRESHASYGSVVQSHVGLSDDDCYARTFHHLPAVCHGVEPHAFSHAADALRRSRDLADQRRIRKAANPKGTPRGSGAHLARRLPSLKTFFVKESFTRFCRRSPVAAPSGRLLCNGTHPQTAPCSKARQSRGTYRADADWFSPAAIRAAAFRSLPRFAPTRGKIAAWA